MRILLLSDIHANLEALDACLAAAPAYDQIVNLGDIVGYGASPNEVTERSRELGYRVSEKDIMQAIREEPAFQIQGKYSPEVAKERLAQAGISLSAFETELRDALQRAQVQNGIAVSDFQTPAEIARARLPAPQSISLVTKSVSRQRY